MKTKVISTSFNTFLRKSLVHFVLKYPWIYSGLREMINIVGRSFCISNGNSFHDHMLSDSWISSNFKVTSKPLRHKTNM